MIDCDGSMEEKGSETIGGNMMNPVLYVQVVDSFEVLSPMATLPLLDARARWWSKVFARSLNKARPYTV